MIRIYTDPKSIIRAPVDDKVAEVERAAYGSRRLVRASMIAEVACAIGWNVWREPLAAGE